MSNNKLNQHKLTVHIRYESTEYVKLARIVFETKVSLTRQGRGPSAESTFFGSAKYSIFGTNATRHKMIIYPIFGAPEKGLV